MNKQVFELTIIYVCSKNKNFNTFQEKLTNIFNEINITASDFKQKEATIFQGTKMTCQIKVDSSKSYDEKQLVQEIQDLLEAQKDILTTNKKVLDKVVVSRLQNDNLSQEQKEKNVKKQDSKNEEIEQVEEQKLQINDFKDEENRKVLNAEDDNCNDASEQQRQQLCTTGIKKELSNTEIIQVKNDNKDIIEQKKWKSVEQQDYDKNEIIKVIQNSIDKPNKKGTQKPKKQDSKNVKDPLNKNTQKEE